MGGRCRENYTLEISIQVLSDFLMCAVSFHEHTQNYYHLQRIINFPPKPINPTTSEVSLGTIGSLQAGALLVIKNKG